MNTRRATLALSLLLPLVILAACSRTQAAPAIVAPPLTAHDLDQLKQRVTLLEARAMEAEKQVIQAQETRDNLRMRVQVIEARFEIQPPGATTSPAKSAAAAPTQHGGFTDFAGSPGIVNGAGSSPQVQLASNDSQIQAYCAKEWPNNYRMQAWCQDRQEKAKGELSSGAPNGISWSEYSGIKDHCVKEWPDNYAMQAWCVNSEQEALKRIRH
jgi:hypothetical protein